MNVILVEFTGLYVSELRGLLSVQLQEELTLFDNPTLLNHLHTSEATLNRMIDFWQHEKNIQVWLAKVGPHVIGFSAGQLKPDIYNNCDVITGEILAIYVEVNSRHKGVGTLLMTKAEQWMQQCGAHAANVSWLEGNSASQALYRTKGYTPVYATGRKIFEKQEGIGSVGSRLKG